MKNFKFFTREELQEMDIEHLVGVHKYYYDFNLNLILDFEDNFFSSLDFLKFKNDYFIDYYKPLLRSFVYSKIVALQIASYNHFILINTLIEGGLFNGRKY